ncbi:MAG: oligosaccharide flippase family protein, partial [Limisphaerales bacterium]
MGIKRQFFWSMTPLLVISAVNIISVRLFYQFLGPEMYAIWFYVIALNGAFGFTDLGVSAAMGRFLGMALGAQDRAALEQYWGTGNLLALVIISVMAAIVAAVGVLFGPDWFQVAPGRVHLLQWAFVAGGFGLWMGYYGNFWLVLSQAHFDFKFIGICRSVFNLAQVGVGLWLAWLTHNPLVLIAAGALFGFLQVLLFAWHAARHYRLGMGFGHFRKGRAREMFGISNKVFGTILMGSVGGSMDRLILGKLAPPAPFAHYNICNSFGSRIGNLGGSIMGPIIQQTSRALGRG